MTVNVPAVAYLVVICATSPAELGEPFAIVQRNGAAPPSGSAADPEKLKQVLINLVANARDALRSGGALTVRVTGAERPRVEVCDDGPGIEPSVLESVFDPFFTTKPAGTGLGLAIVRKIVDQHGGTIAIDSAPGAGTRVSVELPKWTGPHGKVAPAVTR